MRYSDEFRHRVVAEILPPRNRTVEEVCREHGISTWSLYRWKKAVKIGTLEHGAMKPSERPLAEKLSLLLEGTRVAEEQRGEWLRGRGLHSEHLSLYEQEIRDVMTDKEKRQREEIQRLRQQNKLLERDLSRKEKALAEMAALVALKKKTGSVLRGGGRGVLTRRAERQTILEGIDDARHGGARAGAAAAAAGYSRRTIERWRRHGTIDRRKGAARRVARKLSDAEQQAVVDYACAKQYQDLTPYLIVAKLLTIGIYVAGVSSFYRILGLRRLLTHRAETAPRTRRATPPERIATGPNQVWTWDITWLKSTVRGMFFYAYIVLDLWDRSVVGWRVETEENVEISKELFRDLKAIHGFEGLFVHSDNGNPMKGGTILALFYELGISPSFSRPRVSDDNPYIESFNSTMKRRVDYPNAFEQIGDARIWMADFLHYYNTEHLHSAIGYVTPHQRRRGEDHEIFAARNAALRNAFELHPERWVRGPKYFVHEPTVILNPADRSQSEKISKNLRQLC